MAAGFSGDRKAGRRRGKEEYGVLQCPSIQISAINVNSFNISTCRKTVECKTWSKLDAITQWDSDIILMSGCWLGENGKTTVKQALKEMGYDRMYANSTRSERGVAIAIRKGFEMHISKQNKDAAENYLLLKCMIDKTEMLVGVVYGPNKNDKDFFLKLIRTVEKINLPTILGGDFNTVVDENLDLENRPDIPNYDNSEILHDWLEDGNFCDPYRAKHPRGKAMSFGFRQHDSGKSRLDFFIISEDLFDGVDDVKYKYIDRPDCGFDHAEVRLSLG
jgi:exonuclease III